MKIDMGMTGIIVVAMICMAAPAMAHPATPFMVDGHVYTSDGNPCNGSWICITNLNTGVMWDAENDSGSNYYLLEIASDDVSVDDILQLDISGCYRSETVERTVTADDIGGFTEDITLEPVSESDILITRSYKTLDGADTFTITYTICNWGSNHAGASTTWIYIDDVFVTSDPVPALSGGETYNSTVGPFGRPYNATIEVTVCADGAEIVEEGYETNNCLENVFTFKAPDLTITAINTSDYICYNTTTHINATVENTGNTAAGTFDLALKMGDTVIGEVTLTSLAVSASENVTFTWTPESWGLHDLTVTADPGGAIYEQDRTNNSRTVQVLARIGDLVPVKIEPKTIPLNYPGYVRAIIRNNGTMDVPAFKVTMKVGDTLLGTKTIWSLGAYEEDVVWFEWTPVSAGTFDMAVTVDPENVIDESDNSNNDRTAAVEVSEPDIIRVPEDYDEICEAIDHASNGTIILISPPVDGNTYCGPLVTIPESLSDIRLIANGDVVIKCTAKGCNQVTVNGTGCTIQGFGITGGGSGSRWPNYPGAGIMLYGAYNIISDNHIYSTCYGMKFHNASYNLVVNNTIGNPACMTSPELWGNYNQIVNNTLEDFDIPLPEKPASHNTLSGNTFTYYPLLRGSDNLIYNNRFLNDTILEYGNIYNIPKTPGTNIVGGPYLGGNYWNDYSGVDKDGDGIGDTPHSYDQLPLVERTPLIGDVTGDGRITSADAAIILQMAVSGEYSKVADVSCDDCVTSLDALIVLQQIKAT